MEIVRIVCPKCHVELDVKNKLNVEQKLIKCPNCGCQLMVRFKQNQQPPQQQQPQYRPPVQDDGHTIYAGHPQYQAQPAQAPTTNVFGYIVYNNVRYPLSIGRNTIGRKSSTPQATVQIDTNGNNTMSRLHAVIEAVRMGDMSIRAIISNGSNKNPTFVSGVLLNGADKLILKNGAEIKMGSIILRYEIAV